MGPSEVRELIKPYTIPEAVRPLQPPMVLYLLKLSDWDPTTLLPIAPAIFRQPDAWTGLMRTKLLEAAGAIGSNHYPLGNIDNVPYRLGRIFQILDEPVTALGWFQRSMDEYGQDPRSLLRIAQCHLAKGNKAEADRYHALSENLYVKRSVALSLNPAARTRPKETTLLPPSPEAGALADSPCICGSGLKYKDCHGRFMF